MCLQPSWLVAAGRLHLLRRAWDASIRTVDAAITRHRSQESAAGGALIHDATRVHRHSLFLLRPTNRAGERREQSDIICHAQAYPSQSSSPTGCEGGPMREATPESRLYLSSG